MCFGCTRDYLNAKGLDFVKKLEHLEDNVLLEEISCPHCFTMGFFPSVVHKDEIIRDYSYKNPPAGNHYNQPSPLRVGESFEDMKRKMIPFKALSSIPSSSSITNSATKLNTKVADVSSSSKPLHSQGIAMLNNSPMMESVHDTSVYNDSSHSLDHSLLCSAQANNVLALATPRLTEMTPRSLDHSDEHISRLLSINTMHMHTPTYIPKTNAEEMIDPDVFIPDDLSDTMDMHEESYSNVFPQLHSITPYRHKLAENVVRSVFDHAMHNAFHIQQPLLLQ